MKNSLVTNIKPISYIKSHAADMMKYVGESKSPMIITQNGEAKAVLMDIESYNEMQDAFSLLNIIRIAEKEIEEGKVVDADTAFSEIEAAFFNEQ